MTFREFTGICLGVLAIAFLGELYADNQHMIESIKMCQVIMIADGMIYGCALMAYGIWKATSFDF